MREFYIILRIDDNGFPYIYEIRSHKPDAEETKDLAATLGQITISQIKLNIGLYHRESFQNLETAKPEDN